VGSGGPGISENVTEVYLFWAQAPEPTPPSCPVQYADGVGWGKGTEDKSRVRDVSGVACVKISVRACREVSTSHYSGR